MAMTPQERDEKRKKKEAKAGIEDLRMKAGRGTRQALAEIMEWAEVEENGEAMTLLIHRIHELGPEAARHFLSAPRHEITLSSSVVRRLDQFRLSRELRAPGLELGDDPDDTGLLLLADLA
ncbi:hypothetical protein HFV04_021660 [Pseudomonas sp. BIGb0427]|uniref:hypothetical protein n=1 Tax=unclassified Pseudomonas TaxID=196821 RepID=UPI0016BA05EC|nr:MULTISPECIES: hypothetical protein [unclassified Pseudomonas]NLU60455.1 hypothetical protein [Pseudomonas sp. BIGb0427]QPG62110.1 hypothetical protein HFV04_021660 [Pseudomonas sp. BIGb0427]UVL53991.1 hypothetical protein LOY22_13955 [Pseudomonas sp. B21-035]UVL59247.1 hypothetical protein LOY54_14385 [Pseudomonas sp. B21-032]